MSRRVFHYCLYISNVFFNSPDLGTPEYLVWVNELRERAWKEDGLRRFGGDEVLIAMERERAGYDGLGELWGCVPAPTLTQM
jgi:hypothetical protein